MISEIVEFALLPNMFLFQHELFSESQLYRDTNLDKHPIEKHRSNRLCASYAESASVDRIYVNSKSLNLKP